MTRGVSQVRFGACGGAGVMAKDGFIYGSRFCFAGAMAQLEARLHSTTATPEDQADAQDSLDTIFSAIRATMTEATMETSRVLQVRLVLPPGAPSTR